MRTTDRGLTSNISKSGNVATCSQMHPDINYLQGDSQQTSFSLYEPALDNYVSFTVQSPS